MRKLLAIGVAAALLSFTWATTAHASTGTTNGGNPVSIALTAGTPSISGGVPTNLTSVGLTGYDQTPTTTLTSLTVVDNDGGTGDWHVTVDSGNKSLQCTTSSTCGTDQLGALTLGDSASHACASGSSCSTPGTFTHAGGQLDNVASRTIATATGARGAYTLPFSSPDLSLVIPGSARAGSYGATITFTLTIDP